MRERLGDLYGIRARHPARQPEHRRLQWSRQYLWWGACEWRRVLVTELMAWHMSTGAHVNVTSGHVFWKGGVMIWGGITAEARTPIIVIKGNLNIVRYRDEILRLRLQQRCRNSAKPFFAYIMLIPSTIIDVSRRQWGEGARPASVYRVDTLATDCELACEPPLVLHMPYAVLMDCWSLPYLGTFVFPCDYISFAAVKANADSVCCLYVTIIFA